MKTKCVAGAGALPSAQYKIACFSDGCNAQNDECQLQAVHAPHELRSGCTGTCVYGAHRRALVDQVRALR